MAERDLFVTIEDEPDESVTVAAEGGAEKDGVKPEAAKTGEQGIDDLVRQVKTLEEREQREKTARVTAESRAAESDATARRATEEAVEARKTAAERELDSVANALSAAEAEEEGATRELQSAHEAGDAKAIAEANRKIARASSRVVALETGKAEMEARRKEAPAAETRRAEPQQRPDPVEGYISQFHPRSQAWLRQHTDCVTDKKLNNKVLAAHNMAESEGIAPNTDEYFAYLDEFMGYGEAEKPAPKPGNGATPPARRGAPPSAPVSRAAGSSGSGDLVSGEVKLSAREARAAQDGTIVWNSGAEKGKPIGVKEFARRKVLMTRDGYYDPANYGH